MGEVPVSRHGFMSLVAHELRNPLTPIRAYAQRMQRRGEYDAEATSRIVSEVDRLRRLIDDLVETDSADLDHVRLRLADVDVVALVRSCVDEMHLSARDHHIGTDLPDAPIVCRCDPDRVQQILMNLLLNAVRHTPPGTDVVAAVRPRAGAVTLTVSDNGPGIPPEDLLTLFEVTHGRRSSTAGLGLGLYITRKLVDAHAGGIRVISHPGAGTAFDVWLPLPSPGGGSGSLASASRSTR